MSDIFSDKYDAKITIKFIKENERGNISESKHIGEKQILHKQA